MHVYRLSNGRFYRRTAVKDTFFIGFGKTCSVVKAAKLPFQASRSQADLTLADFWGAERLKGIDTLDNKGVSLVIANTPKGQATLDSIREKCYLMETSFREAALGNPRVTESAPMPRSRALFFDDLIRGMRFSSLRRKYMNPFVQTLKLSAKRIAGPRFIERLKKLKRV